MITLDYTLREVPPESRDLAEVDENVLHYDLFLGDICFRIDTADMSASWGWIPIIDFAVCLERIVNELVPGEPKSFEFTESANRIDFTLRDRVVEIRTTYGKDQAKVPWDELFRSAQEFLHRVLDDLTARYSTLAQNAYVRRLYAQAPATSAAQGRLRLKN